MRTPRGPIVAGGQLTREWRDALASAVSLADVPGWPRDEIAPQPGPGWRAMFRRLARAARVEVPRGPVSDPAGNVTPEWRRWFERV